MLPYMPDDAMAARCHTCQLLMLLILILMFALYARSFAIDADADMIRRHY